MFLHKITFIWLVKSTKKFIRFQNYIEPWIILVCELNGWVLIYGFILLVDIPVGIVISAVGLKTCVITTIIKTHYWNIKKEEKVNHDEVLILIKLS